MNKKNRLYRLEREEKLMKEQAIINTGKCPYCNSPIRKNNALTGWYQCSQYGAEGFRANNDMPACSWQTFGIEAL